MKKFRGIFEQHREVGRFRPVKPRIVKAIGPRPTVDSAGGNIKEEQELDKKTPSVEELAKKHNMSVSDIEDLVSHGTKTEMEHTKEKNVAREIAMDHIKEKPDYYKRLKKYVESVQDTLHARHQELRKKSGLPHPDYYKELGKSYEIEDHEQRAKKQAEIRAKYGQQRESVEDLEEAQDYKVEVTHKDNDGNEHKMIHNLKNVQHRRAAGYIALQKHGDMMKKKGVEYKSASARIVEDIEQLDEMPGANMDTRAVHQHLKKQGWKITRTSGGHDVFTHPDAEHHIAVPRHRQLKAPLVKGILKQAKVNEEIELEKNSSAARTYKEHPQKEPMKKMKEEKEMKGEDPCWKGYEMVGQKMKGGKKVPNCVPVKEEKDDVGEMIKDKLKIIINRAQEMHDHIDSNTDMPEWVKSKITLAQDYISTACDYSCGKEQLGEESDNLQEGRPSQRHPLEGHEYHKKTDAELIYIAKDAHKAAEAMKGHNTQAENKYRDQANDSATVRYFRQKNGMPDWYKKKYGHMKEDISSLKAVAKNALNRQVSEMKTFKESLQESRKAEIVKDIMKKKKETKASEDKFQPDPILTSQIVKEHK